MRVLIIKKESFGVIEYLVDNIEFDETNIYLTTDDTVVTISKAHYLLYIVN